MIVVVLFSILEDWTKNDQLIAEDAAQELADGVEKTGLEVEIEPLKDRTVEEAMSSYDPSDTVVVNWCEGLYRDERNFHSVPAELERLGFCYTGSNPRTLQLGQSKVVVKQILSERGIPNPPSTTWSKHCALAESWQWFPAIVKPANEHGSFGITRDSIVDSRPQLDDRVRWCAETYPGPVVVENFVDGDEYNVAIWGAEGELEVLPLAAIDYGYFQDYHDRLCSFEAKWKEGTDAYIHTKVHCPAEVDESLAERLQATALRAFVALGIRDYGRVDMRVRNGIPYVLDVNANPDITRGGGMAKAARAAGFTYGQMARRLVDLAAARCGIGKGAE